MLIAEVITIAASSLLLINEIRNLSKTRILDRFVNQVHIFTDRLDCIEKILNRLLQK